MMQPQAQMADVSSEVIAALDGRSATVVPAAEGGRHAEAQHARARAEELRQQLAAATVASRRARIEGAAARGGGASTSVQAEEGRDRRLQRLPTNDSEVDAQRTVRHTTAQNALTDSGAEAGEACDMRQAALARDWAAGAAALLGAKTAGPDTAMLRHCARRSLLLCFTNTVTRLTLCQRYACDLRFAYGSSTAAPPPACQAPYMQMFNALGPVATSQNR